MPVTLTPYDENETILVYTFKGNWSWSEFINVDDDVWTYFENTDKRIDLIFDLSDSNRIPIGIGEIIKRAGRRNEPANRGFAIIVNPPIILPIILGTLQKIYPVAASVYRTADKLDDALKMIELDRKQ